MDKHELAAFLRGRRARLHPGDVGLPSGPRRRTPGLRREEVAVLSHISTEYYTRLEQGRAPRPSSEVLAAIAAALRLTEAERTHLHVLAGAVVAPRTQHRRDVRPSILTMLQRLPDTAGFVMSACFEVLAWNALAAALMEDFDQLAPAERNLARKAFLPTAGGDIDLYGISDLPEFRHHVVMQLAVTKATYPNDPVVRELIDDLQHGSAEFTRLWQHRDIDAAPMLSKTFDHPRIGPITLDCDTLLLAERDQHLVLYTASAGSPDAEKLALLSIIGIDTFDANRTSDSTKQIPL